MENNSITQLHCPKCGAATNAGQKFCTACGANLQATVENNFTSAQPPVTPTVLPAPVSAIPPVSTVSLAKPDDAPVAPQYAQSVAPQYNAPVQPVQPQYNAPVQPEYAQPVQPQYNAPAQPAQPQYNAPAQSGFTPQGVYNLPVPTNPTAATAAPTKIKRGFPLPALIAVIAVPVVAVGVFAAYTLLNKDKQSDYQSIEKKNVDAFFEGYSDALEVTAPDVSFDFDLKVTPGEYLTSLYNDYVDGSVDSTAIDALIKNGLALSGGVNSKDGNYAANFAFDVFKADILGNYEYIYFRIPGIIDDYYSASLSELLSEYADSDAISSLPGADKLPDLSSIFDIAGSAGENAPVFDPDKLNATLKNIAYKYIDMTGNIKGVASTVTINGTDVKADKYHIEITDEFLKEFLVFTLKELFNNKDFADYIETSMGGLVTSDVLLKQLTTEIEKGLSFDYVPVVMDVYVKDKKAISRVVTVYDDDETIATITFNNYAKDGIYQELTVTFDGETVKLTNVSANGKDGKVTLKSDADVFTAKIELDYTEYSVSSNGKGLNGKYTLKYDDSKIAEFDLKYSGTTQDINGNISIFGQTLVSFEYSITENKPTDITLPANAKDYTEIEKNAEKISESGIAFIEANKDKSPLISAIYEYYINAAFGIGGSTNSDGTYDSGYTYGYDNYDKYDYDYLYGTDWSNDWWDGYYAGTIDGSNAHTPITTAAATTAPNLDSYDIGFQTFDEGYAFGLTAYDENGDYVGDDSIFTANVSDLWWEGFYAAVGD
ncbi:MAG: hypothetical protein LBN42_04580 [Oscillospiraceae bacterium]|jgi:hypothetical protein|nr:hypothetical protein [Oscillospiraceae bacterium]